jgi:hypothetical protein
VSSADHVGVVASEDLRQLVGITELTRASHTLTAELHRWLVEETSRSLPTRRHRVHRFVGAPVDLIAVRSTLTGEHLAGYVRT